MWNRAPYEHFCEDAWWKMMDIILAEAEKRGMRVWILDDKHFPTGYANGILEHEDLNRVENSCGNRMWT